MVQVFKAELDKVKTVAVKFHSGQDLPTMKQFAVEVDIMRACRDDNIVTFLGAWLQQVSALLIIRTALSASIALSELPACCIASASMFA